MSEWLELITLDNHKIIVNTRHIEFIFPATATERFEDSDHSFTVYIKDKEKIKCKEKISSTQMIQVAIISIQK